MKRRLIPGLMLAITLSFAGCTDQLVSPIQENDIIVDDAIKVPSQVADGDPYQVLVESNETKTITEQGTNGKWSTYWVDAASASQNARSGPDMINLFSKKTGSQDYKSHGKFTYVGNQTFDGNLSGGLEDLGDSNDWYSIYPFNENSSSAATGITASVVIGASSANEYTQVQNGANSMSHLAGDYYPMYGIKNNVAKNKTPKFKMSHLYSVIALKITNIGDGNSDNTNAPITINTIEIKAPEPIVGDFLVSISGDEPVYYENGNVSSVASIQYIGDPIPANGEVVIYLAVKPFEASNKEITISINGQALKGNGTSRTISMPVNMKFEAGKKTVLNVPVRHIHSKATDALNVKFKDFTNWNKSTNHLSLSHPTPTNACINGETVQIYTQGTESSPGTVTIRGTAADLIRYAPAGFYAASWGNEKAIMRLNKVKMTFLLLVIPIPITLEYNQLIGMIDEETINFGGLLPLGENHNNIVFLDDEPYYKEIGKTQIDNLLARFDNVPNDPNDELVPTFEGLRQALTDPDAINTAGTPAEVTSTILFNKIKFTMDNNPSIKEKFGAIEGLFDYPALMFSLLKLCLIEVELKTLPEGSKVGSLTATDPRLVVWGIDITQ